MDISRRDGKAISRTLSRIGGNLRNLRTTRSLVLPLLVILLAACTPVALASLRSTRPLAKIALIAPFEGLYRQTGYDALDALRLAIAESPDAPVDLLPLALDDSADPLRSPRTAQKILADPETAAIVGPLSPATMAAAAPILANSPVPWIAPLRIDPGGAFAPPASEAWAMLLLTEIAAAARAQGAARMLVVHAPGWPDFSTLEPNAFDLPLQIAEDARSALEQFMPGDAFLWLGEAHEGALVLGELRAQHADAIFWLGPQGGDPVFAAHAQISAPVFWAIWSDDAYNHPSQADSALSPGAYLVYRAAQAAVAQAAGRQPEATHAWRIAFYRLDASGISTPWTPE